jgi:hypothetical protein
MYCPALFYDSLAQKILEVKTELLKGGTRRCAGEFQFGFFWLPEAGDSSAKPCTI